MPRDLYALNCHQSQFPKGHQVSPLPSALFGWCPARCLHTLSSKFSSSTVQASGASSAQPSPSTVPISFSRSSPDGPPKPHWPLPHSALLLNIPSTPYSFPAELSAHLIDSDGLKKKLRQERFCWEEFIWGKILSWIWFPKLYQISTCRPPTLEVRRVYVTYFTIFEVFHIFAFYLLEGTGVWAIDCGAR